MEVLLKKFCGKVDHFRMDTLKKHYLLAIWCAGLLICSILRVSFWGMVLGSAVFAVLILFLRFYRSIFWMGYLLHGVLNQPEAALPLYHYAYRHGGKVGPPMIAYAMLLMQKWQYPEALAVLQKVQEIETLNPALRKISRQDLALACEKTGDVQSAIGIMEKMRQDYEYFRSDFYATLAYFYIETGAYDIAEEYNDLALAEDETCGAVYDNQALIAYQKGNLEQAEVLFQKALELEASMISPQYFLGLIAEEKGDRDTAAQYFLALHDAEITGLNTISKEQVEEKYLQYYSLQSREETCVTGGSFL